MTSASTCPIVAPRAYCPEPAPEGRPAPVLGPPGPLAPPPEPPAPPAPPRRPAPLSPSMPIGRPRVSYPVVWYCPSSLPGPWVQVGRPNAGRLQFLRDRAVQGGHGTGQRARDLFRQHAAHLRPLADHVASRDQGLADRFRAQRIAGLAIGAVGAVQQSHHQGVELAQLPLAFVLKRHADAFGADLDLNLAVVHQAQALPARAEAAAGLRVAFQAAQVCGHALVQPFVETHREGRLLAVQLELARQQVFALPRPRAGQCRHAEGVDAALGGVPRGDLDALDGLDQGGRLERGGGTHVGGARPRSRHRQTAKPRRRAHGPQYAAKTASGRGAGLTSSTRRGSRATAPRPPAARPGAAAGRPSSGG
jgi:hypothetical protein